MTLRETIVANVTDCESYLDLCAGMGPWIYECKGYKIAIELNPKYNKTLHKLYNEVFNDDVKLMLKPKDFQVECTLWIDGVEHLEEDDAVALLDSIERFTTKKILIMTPNEFINNKRNADEMKEPLQEHKSFFPKEFWLKRNYKIIYEEYNKREKVNNILYIKDVTKK